jgi:hypothetical protein
MTWPRRDPAQVLRRIQNCELVSPDTLDVLHNQGKIQSGSKTKFGLKRVDDIL